MRSPLTSTADEHSGETDPATSDENMEQEQQQQPPCHDDDGGGNDKVDDDCDNEQVVPMPERLNAPPLPDQQQKQPEEADPNELVQGPTALKDDIGGDTTVNDDGGAGSSPPLRRRKTWNLNSKAEFNFARGEDPSPGSSPGGSVRRPEADEQSPIGQSERSPP